MSINYIKVLENGSRIGVWRIKESLPELLQRYKPDDVELRIIHSKRSKKRQKEWLAVRLLLKEMLPGEARIGYEHGGRPFLLGSALFVSISHSNHLAALLLSPVGPVGVDIQHIAERPLAKGIDFFLTEREQKVLHNLGDLQSLHLYWSIKEAVFKACPNVEDMKNQILINPFQVEREGLASCKLTTDPGKELSVAYWFIDGYILASTLVL